MTGEVLLFGRGRNQNPGLVHPMERIPAGRDSHRCRVRIDLGTLDKRRTRDRRTRGSDGGTTKEVPAIDIHIARLLGQRLGGSSMSSGTEASFSTALPSAAFTDCRWLSGTCARGRQRPSRCVALSATSSTSSRDMLSPNSFGARAVTSGAN
ncbi:Uncharacterised protein [Mycobacteroides abscessus subsp. abscessus]|nr:Uncharacterised protein [Mycobacteroides abscessus subsp. abscessus]